MSDIVPVLSKAFLHIQATIECRFTLKHVHDMIITYSEYYISLCFDVNVPFSYLKANFTIVVRDLGSENKGSRFDSSCYLSADLQKWVKVVKRS